MLSLERRYGRVIGGALCVVLLLCQLLAQAAHAGSRPGTVPVSAITITPGIELPLSWGANNAGQVGDGSTADRLSPVTEENGNALLGASAVAAGGDHTLLIAPSGITTVVWAWGNNGHGQLGNATTEDSSVPVQVVTANGPLQGVDAIAAGSDYSLALESNGTVWAWGNNDHGQLGVGTTIDSAVAVQVPALSNVVEIEAGQDFAMALEKCSRCTSGTVWTWGHNDRGQLGNGTTTDSMTPVMVGDPQQPSQPLSVKVPQFSTDHSMAAGGAHALAVRNDGTLWAWGDNASGQLGVGSTVSQTSPVQIVGLHTAYSVAAGQNFSLAYDPNSGLWAWGDDSEGQLGNDSRVASSAPIAVKYPGNPPLELAAGDDFGMVVDYTGKVWGWGDNSHGELGDATTISSLIPIAAPGIESAKSVAAGAAHTVVLTYDVQPPTTTASFSPAPDASGSSPAPLTVTLRASDPGGSGVNATYYTIDDPTCTAPTGPLVLPVPSSCLAYSGPFTITTPGRHVIYYFSVDKGSNVEDTQVAVVTVSAAPALFVHATVARKAVAAGAEQGINVQTIAGAKISIALTYPNGEKVHKHIIADTLGSAKWTFIQPAGVTTNTNRIVILTVTATDSTGRTKKAHTRYLIR